jgi:cytidine deaminase
MNKPIQAMHALAIEAKSHAYVPYSQFAVGACLRAENGEFFVGCNVENASYGLTLCAEAGAIMAMLASGQRHFTDLVIVSNANKPCPPCGACRQRLIEFAATGAQVHLFDQEGGHHEIAMLDLLPFSFDQTFFK